MVLFAKVDSQLPRDKGSKMAKVATEKVAMVKVPTGERPAASRHQIAVRASRR